MANRKVQACFMNTIGLENEDRMKLTARAKTYGTGDSTQDYILATNDMLAYLRENLAAVEEAVANAVATNEPAVVKFTEPPKGAEKEVQKAEPAYASPDEAWEDMKPDDAPALSMLSPVQQAEWIVLYETNQVSQINAAEILKSRTKIVTGETGRVEQLTKKIREEQRQEEQRQDTPETKDQEEVDTLIETIETTKSKVAYQQAILSLIDILYQTPSKVTRYDKNKKPIQVENKIFTKIYEFLNDLPVNNAYREAFVEFARVTKSSATRDVEEGEKASGRIKARNAKGEYTPVFNLILRAQMLDPLRQKFGFDNLPEDMQLKEKAPLTDLPENKVLEKPKKDKKNVIKNWDAEDGAFFRDDGQPISTPVAAGRVRMLISQFMAKLQVKPRVFVFRNQADLKAKDPELYAQAVAARPQGDFDATSAVGYSFGGTPPSAPVGVSRRQFLQGVGAVAVAGKANLADMDKKELWDQFFLSFDKLQNAIYNALESLPRDTYISAEKEVYTILKENSLAYRIQRGYETDDPSVWERFSLAYDEFKTTGETASFPDITEEKVSKSRRVIESAIKSIQKITQKEASKAEAKPVPPTVIIFSDRVRTEQQLNFVLAHESMGHIGFRALIPQNKFDSLMNSIYDMSPAIRFDVDAAMAARGIPKAEAVEEYLADFAAELDVSIVARIWNAIKNALNKLGVKFGDDAARYFVNLARKYVRNGDTSSFFRAQDMVKELRDIENGIDPFNSGRFALSQTFRADNIVAGNMQNNIEGAPMSLDRATSWFRSKGIDANTTWDKFVGEFFSLLSFRARRNPGLAALEELLSNGRDLSMSIKVEMKERLKEVLDKAVEIPGSKMKIGEATKERLTRLNNYIYQAQRYAASRIKESDIGSAKLLSIDQATGMPVKNNAEINRIYNMGLLKFEQMRNGFSYEDTYEEAGKTVTKVIKVPGMPDLTEDSFEWKGYLAVREAMRDIEIKLLEARYLSFIEDRKLAEREMAEVMRNKKVSKDAKDLIERMYRKYKELWTTELTVNDDGDFRYSSDSIARANEFLELFNKAILGKDTDRSEELWKQFFDKVPKTEIVDQIEMFKGELAEGFRDNKELKFTIQNKLKDIIVAETGNEQGDAFTKRTLATGYTPILRRGDWEVRISAFNTAGKRVVLEQDYKDQLAYRQFENQSEALEIADMMNGKLFGDKTYEVMARDPDSGQFALTRVRLQAVAGAALDSVASPPQLNLDEFTRGLRRFHIVLPPKKLEEVIVAMTAQNNRARQRLRRAFVPGGDEDAVRAVTEHIEARASTISKVFMRPRVNELMNLNIADTKKLWYGDEARLKALKDNWERLQNDPTVPSETKGYARKEYERYLFMYNQTKPEGKAELGNQFFNEGSRLMQFVDNNRDLSESDYGSGEIASRIRATTSVVQLGGSIATGALNFIGVITNTIPFLATYNPNTAFGGGFGFGKSMAAFQLALSNVGLVRALRNPELNTAEFYEKLATNPLMRSQYGLTAAEAKFIGREIREGAMIPAQTNALIETARGRTNSGIVQKGIDGFMWTFNATEQASRRAAGLAAYRLEFNRRKAAGLSDEKAGEYARLFAVETLKNTLGEYSVLNRPPAWRSGIQSFLYMYKVFPTMSIQLLKALPRDGQIYMLTAMFLLAGVSGFPFAEDMEDIIDTIMQKLGFRTGSIRLEAAQAIDKVLPGYSNLVLSGAANWVLPADLAGRVSMGDFIPGTGLLLAGSNTGREIAEVGGPAVSMMFGDLGAVNSAATAIKAAATEKVTLEDWLRENPVTALRIVGDSLAYVNSGAVVDRKGYVVDQDAGAAVILTRLLGFYPAGAADEYGIVRISKRVVDYQKEVTAGFRQAWIKAMIQKDPEQARAIVQAVNDWNEGAEGTALEIRNFEKNARQALREASRPAGERLLRSAPKAAKDDIEQAADLLGY